MRDVDYYLVQVRRRELERAVRARLDLERRRIYHRAPAQPRPRSAAG